MGIGGGVGEAAVGGGEEGRGGVSLRFGYAPQLSSLIVKTRQYDIVASLFNVQ